MISIKNADAALKDYYLDAVTTQLNEGISPFFNAIEKTTKNVFGKEVKMLIARKSMGNVTAGDEDGDLPEAYSNRYYSVTLPLKNIYGTIEISDKAIRASTDSSGAFVNLLNAEMEGLVASAKENFSRMIFGCEEAILTKIVEVDANDNTVLTLAECKSWYDGLNVEIRNGDREVLGDLNILSVDVANKQVRLDGALPSVIKKGYSLCVGKAFGKELQGLGNLFDYDALYGYDKAQYSYFNPYTFKSNTFTEDDIIDVIDTLEERTGEKVKMIVCSPAMRRKIAGMLTDNRSVVTGAELAGGYTSIYVNDVPLVTDRYCPDNRIYFLNPEDFTLNQLCDWEWLEDEDGKVLKQIPGKAAYSATLVKYAELVCTRPYAQGAIIVE